ncbi:hypothetical protein BLNAU_8611 [Blattamonas nauphoetae]|uniref:Protein kinase domain-containing protein n=1 Tax=Blattamonas nauphoetae TaxID=2049346 RepID=A0ABQ9XY52_9EUKA|nr:hypothetical protein BLNAU_8611 [Blattamonas nauphoetae]
MAEKTDKIPVTPIIKIESNGAISFTDTTFDECEYSSTDNEKIFIAGSRLHTQIKAAQWKNSFLPTQLRPELMGTDESLGTDHEWYTGSLMYYLVPPVTRILLDTGVTETSTHPNCGSSRFTCSSLDSGYRSAETNEFDEVQMQTNSDLLKTMRITRKVTIQSPSETAIRTITQKSDAGIVVNAEGKTATLKHMIFKLVPATTLETFVSVEAGELSLGKVTFGTDTETALGVSLHSLMRIKEGSTLTIVDTQFQKLSFTHETLGTVLYIEAGGALSTTQGSPFTEIKSNATGSLVFLESDNLERDSKLEPLKLFCLQYTPKTDTVAFTRAQRNLFFGMMDGVAGSLVYYWYPHTSTEEKLTVNDDGDDHVVCGLAELPCSSLDFGFEHLKKEETTLVLSSDGWVGKTLETSFNKETIQGKAGTEKLSFRIDGSLVAGEGQTITMDKLKMEVVEGTREKAVLIAAGHLIVTNTPIGGSSSVSISSALVSVNGGRFDFAQNKIRNIITTDSKSLFEVSSGTLSLNTVTLKWTGKIPSLLTQTDGSTTLTSCSIALESADSSADADVLKVEGGIVEMTGLNLNTQNVLVKSLLAQTGGSVLLSDLSVDFATLTKELISGKGSLTLAKSAFVAGPSSHTSNAAAASTIAFTVKNEQKLTIGDVTNEVTFTNCGGDSNGGALRVEVDDGGELELTNTKLVSCRTSLGGGGVHVSVLSGGRATIVDSSFDGCSASGEGGGMHVKVAGTGTVSISGTFKSCSSDDVGGGLFVDVSSLGAEGSFVLNNLVFGTDSTENKAGTEKTGHSMFIRTAADKRGLINETSVVGSGLSSPSGSVFTAAELELWSFSETNGLSGGIAYLFNIYEGGTLIEDDENGIDHALCGHSHLPCQSLSSSLSNLKGESMEVLLTGDLYLDLAATSTKDSSISPRTDDTQTITITEQVSVTIASNTLTLNSLTFKTTVVDYTTSAIVITSGSLIAESCAFVGITSSQSGPAIFGTIQNGEKLHVTNGKFTSCSSKEEGGAIKIECGDLVTAESLIVKAEFTDCECTDENDESTIETKGWSVHVTGHELARLIAKENWAGYPSEWNNTTEHIVWGEDKKKVGTQFETLPLLFYLIPYFGIEITTGGKGSDAEGCGTQNLLCQSFATGHSHLKGVGDHTLTVKKSTILNEPEQFEGNNVVVESDGSKSTLTVLEEGRLGFEFDVGTSFSVTLKNLEFLMETDSVASLIVSRNAKLTVTGSQFESTRVLKRKLVELVSGSFSMEGVRFVGMTFETSPFSLSSFSKAEFQSLNVTSCDISELIQTESGTNLTINGSSFTAVVKEEEEEEEASNAEGGLCSWKSGLLNLTTTTTSIQDSTFSGWKDGGINQNGGSLTLTNVSFEGMASGMEVFKSMKRNIHCEGFGTIDVVSVGSESDGSESQPSAWFDATNCTVTSTNQIEKSSLFIPTLSSETKNATYDRKNNTGNIVLEGTKLIPCGLRLEVFEWENGTKDGDLESTELDLSTLDTHEWTEELINLTLNYTEKLKRLDAKYEWHGRLAYGVSGKTSSWIKIKDSAAAIRKSQTIEAMKWWLPLLIGILVLVAAIVIVVIVLYLRHKKKKQEKEKNEAKMPMLSAAEMPEEMFQQSDETDKMAQALPEVGDSEAKPPVIPAAPLPSTEEPDAEEKEEEVDDLEELEEAMACDGTGQMKPVDKTKTLFKKLHGPKKDDSTDINDLQNQLLKGLTYAAGTGAHTKMLTTLSPHSVLLDKGDKVFLQIPKEGDAAGSKAPKKKKGEDGHETQRWEAPEITDGTPGADPEKAAVFSLGLILLEFQTGQVPFGHLDATVATRQLGAGILPDMDGVSDDMIEIIQRCVMSNPDERPTLAEVEEVVNAQ